MYRIRTIGILLIMLMNIGANAHAESPRELVSRGNQAYTEKKYDDALEALLERSIGDTTNFLVAYTHGKVGNFSRAKKITDFLVRHSKETYIPPTMIAIAFLGMDDKGKTFEWLEKANHEKDGWINWILLTLFEPLHGDPRFVELLKKSNYYSTYASLYDID